jgi:DhnA family fructose-bisphosphate aldolase class Ia
MARQFAPMFRRETSLERMLTASAAGWPAGVQMTPIGSVEEALRMAADAVVVYLALAGGSLISDFDLLTRMEQARQVGTVGSPVGRDNCEHDRPREIPRAIRRIFRDRGMARQAPDELNGGA